MIAHWENGATTNYVCCLAPHIPNVPMDRLVSVECAYLAAAATRTALKMKLASTTNAKVILSSGKFSQSGLFQI